MSTNFTLLELWNENKEGQKELDPNIVLRNEFWMLSYWETIKPKLSKMKSGSQFIPERLRCGHRVHPSKNHCQILQEEKILFIILFFLNNGVEYSSPDLYASSTEIACKGLYDNVFLLHNDWYGSQF